MEAGRAVDAVAVEQREGGDAEIGRAGDEVFGIRAAFEEAEGGAGVKLDVHTAQSYSPATNQELVSRSR
jgi:hypothetical protein